MNARNQTAQSSIIVLLGPPGAGKGTQAEYLVEEFGVLHLETSRIIQEALASHDDHDEILIGGASYPYREERRKFFSGELNAPPVVSAWIAEATRSLYPAGKHIVFSGSPRTAFEAEQLFPVFLELAGKGRCLLFHLEVPFEVSLERNSHRLLCALCRLPHREGVAAVCRRCGGALKRRAGLDDPDTIRVRWQQFVERTLPVVDAAKRFGVPVERVDAVRLEADIRDDLRRRIFERGFF